MQRMFPIIGMLRVVEAQHLQRHGFAGPVLAIPWEMIESHAKQAQYNHTQTLERLAERGGLTALEALAVITDQPWYSLMRIAGIGEVEAHMHLHVKLLEWAATHLT